MSKIPFYPKMELRFGEGVKQNPVFFRGGGGGSLPNASQRKNVMQSHERPLNTARLPPRFMLQNSAKDDVFGETPLR